MRIDLSFVCGGMCSHGCGIIDSIFVWLISVMRLPLRSTSRSRAVVARRAHNPKVGSSNPPLRNKKVKPRFGFLIFLDSVAIQLARTLITFFISCSLRLAAYKRLHENGFVNIFGSPNAGKSTLLNSLIGEKLGYCFV